jgi:hypothetical protein
MNTIKYALLLLVAAITFTSAVEAKVVYRRTSGDRSSLKRRRDQKRREDERKKKARAKAIKDAKERQKKIVEYRKKRIAQAEAREQELREKAQAAQAEKVKEQIAAEKAARQEKLLLGKYDTMAREVRMPSTQRQKLVNMVRKFRGLPPGASGGNSAEIARLQRLMKTANGQQKKIIAARIKAAEGKTAAPAKGSASSSKLTGAEQHRKIMGLLTPPQKAKWGGYTLANDPSLKFTGITLSDKQTKRIRPICDAAAKQLPDEASGIDPAIAAKQRKSVLRKIRIQIIFEVLTPAQRAAVGS